jgi:hypothetical protein
VAVNDADGDRMVAKPALRPWTRAEDKLVKRLSVEAAAAVTGRTISAVINRRHKLGLSHGHACRRWTAAEDRIVLAFKPREARKRLRGRSMRAIYSRRLILARGKRDAGRPRKKHYFRLSPALEELIRERAGKVSAADLARELGVFKQTVYTVARGSAKATGENPFAGTKSARRRLRGLLNDG